MSSSDWQAVINLSTDKLVRLGWLAAAMLLANKNCIGWVLYRSDP